MKRLILLIVSLLSPLGLYSQEKGETGPRPVALLLIPSKETLQEGAWLKNLEKFKKLKVTLALSEEDLKKIEGFRLRTVELINEGRLELALLLSSGPISPLTPETKLNFKNFLGEYPKGAVPTIALSPQEQRQLIKESDWVLPLPLLELNPKEEGSSPPVYVWEEASSPWNIQQVFSETARRLTNINKYEIHLVKDLGEREVEGQIWAWLKKENTLPLLNKNLENALKSEIKVEKSSDSLEFTQIESTQSTAPLKGLRVKNDGSSLIYQILFKENLNEAIKEIRLYIDLNHRIGAGRISLLENVNVPLEDAWEYEILCEKLSPNHWNCQLLSANQARPLYVAVGQTSPNENVLEAQIPKKLLGRDPLRWGYLVCIINADSRVDDMLSSVEKKGELLQKLSLISNLEKEALLLPMMRVQ